MAKTIIQTIGPLYGEVENGTVFGRPNGSIFVPSQNTVTATLPSAYRFVKSNSTTYFICNSTGGNPTADNYLKMVAESQDIANYLQIQIATDSEFTSIIDSTNRSAGLFNESVVIVAYEAGSITPIVADETYYLRVRLMSASGEAVATSETIELTGWTA